MYTQAERPRVTQRGFEATRVQRAFVRLLLAVVCILLASCARAPVQEAPRRLDAIEHIVVIYAENRSFDHLYGMFPGANGVANATAPTNVRPQLDDHGRLKQRPTSPASVLDGPVEVFDGRVTPDGYVVNTSQPPYQPSGVPAAPDGHPDLADSAGYPVPPQTTKTIGDTLSAKGVSWAWYAGAWNAALADGRRDPKEKRQVIYNRDPDSPIFQPHHQPFNYYARFAPGAADRARHLKDLTDLERDIERGTLPQVVFYKPAGHVNEHPSYTDLASGDQHMHELLTRLRNSPQWPKMAVIVTYDENGGFWDHVPPPSGPGWGDRWGPGTRVPALIISPYAKRGFVDKTVYDTTSIIKFVTRRFALEPLPGVRPNAGDLTNAFDFLRN